MSMTQMSRRETIAALALIGTGTLAPLAVAAQVESGIDRAAWDQAFLAYQRAKAVRDHFERTHMEPAHEAFAAELPDGGEGGVIDKGREYGELWHRAYNKHISSRRLNGRPLDEVADELSDALSARSVDVHRVPAPDQAALLWKMEDLWGDDLEGGYAEWIVAQLLADARRLLSQGRA
jgi:hypothetical protein